MKLRSAASVAGLVLILMSGSAHAALIINFVESGPDVVVTGSGTLNLSGLVRDQANYYYRVGEVRASDPVFGPAFGAGYEAPQPGAIDTFVYGYQAISGPSSIGPGTVDHTATTTNGDIFVFSGAKELFLSQSYNSGSSLSFTATFANATFDTLGLMPGHYVYTLPNDNFTLNIGTPIVVTTPLPASAPMFGAGLLALGAVGYGVKRKKAFATSP